MTEIERQQIGQFSMEIQHFLQSAYGAIELGNFNKGYIMLNVVSNKTSDLADMIKGLIVKEDNIEDILPLDDVPIEPNDDIK